MENFKKLVNFKLFSRVRNFDPCFAVSKATWIKEINLRYKKRRNLVKILA